MKGIRVIVGLVMVAASVATTAAEPPPANPGATTYPPGPAIPPENVGKPIGGNADAGFAQLDVNHDGRISKDEARLSTELTARFAELDADQNGKLSRDEYDVFAKEAR
jgi:hypothetical protein